jgi:pyridoxamine 5'-phosphate oxidase
METLPKPPPDDPLPLARRWLAGAADTVETNPWAMALASVSPEGQPSVRYVLLKDLSESEGFIVFYTNYGSRKAAELDSGGRGAGVLYWPDSGRQLRFEGRVARSPAAESDVYFASRARASQLNAWASEQSRPIESPDAMTARLEARDAEFAGMSAVPRPSHWGGYRLFVEAVEFWVSGPDRFHERLRYQRPDGGGWSKTWLQP